MVSPDPKIDPNRDISAVRSSQETQKRKPPTRDFHEVTEQVDEKRYQEEAEEGLSKTKKRQGRTNAPRGNTTVKEHLLSPFDLARNAGTATDGQPNSSDQEEEETDTLSVTEKPFKNKKSYDYEQKKEKEPTNIVHGGGIFGVIEQPDLSSVNSMMAPPLNAFSSSISQVKVAESAVLPRSMQEIIDQIAKEVYILEGKGTKETIIPLKGSFNGSHVIITEFDSANKEMNITIDNLTAKNQELVNTHKNNLVNELAKKDIVVHIFTATTTLESHVRLDAGANDQNARGSSFTKNGQQESKEKRQNKNA